jgi:hypothetical protein
VLLVGSRFNAHGLGVMLGRLLAQGYRSVELVHQENGCDVESLRKRGLDAAVWVDEERAIPGNAMEALQRLVDAQARASVALEPPRPLREAPGRSQEHARRAQEASRRHAQLAVTRLKHQR